MPKFISLIESNPSDPQYPRTSSLEVVEDGNGTLRVVGNLPHGYEFRLKTVDDIEAMRSILDERVSQINAENAYSEAMKSDDVNDSYCTYLGEEGYATLYYDEKEQGDFYRVFVRKPRGLSPRMNDEF